jgi:hypothetical protein
MCHRGATRGDAVIDKTLPPLRRACALAGLGCVALVVWLSWIPREWEVRTGLAGQIEHVIAYAGTAGLLALGFGRGWAPRTGALLVLLAGVLEIGQIWIPGRTSQVIDFVASSGGAILGALAGALTLALAGRLDPPGPASQASPPRWPRRRRG